MICGGRTAALGTPRREPDRQTTLGPLTGRRGGVTSPPGDRKAPLADPPTGGRAGLGSAGLAVVYRRVFTSSQTQPPPAAATTDRPYQTAGANQTSGSTGDAGGVF